MDAPALRSCLANLIANAVKYGGTSRWIGVTASTAPGRKGPEVRIAVTDKGLGISSADLPHIFEPFFRGAEAIAGRFTATASASASSGASSTPTAAG